MSQPVEPTTLDRLTNAFNALVRAQSPTSTFSGIYEYSVIAVTGSAPSATVDCNPTDSSIGLPDLSNIPMQSDNIGGTSTPTVGNLCLVMFINADPSRPVIFGCAPNVRDINLQATNSLGLTAATISMNAGRSTGEHFATTESVINLFINFVYFLNSAGDPSTWAMPSTGNLLDPTTFPVKFNSLARAWLINAANAILPPTAVTGGGVLTSAIIAPSDINTTLALKLSDPSGATPNIGCPNIRGA